VSLERKRRLGDRSDGRRLRTLDPIFGMIPFIMKKRSGASNSFSGTLDITEAEKFIRQKRTEDMPELGMLHFLVATYLRIVSQKPEINRFISGQRIYARNDVQVSLAVKKGQSVQAQEATVKAYLDQADTLKQVYEKLQAVIDEGKREGDSNNTDHTARFLNHIPRLFLRFVIGFLECLDYFGILPKALLKVSPFHGSLFVSDLGSVALPPVYHHLYDFGNIPLFLTFGTKTKRSVIDKKGVIVQSRQLDFTLMLDERICDGFYFSGVLRMLGEIMKNPAKLNEPPEKVYEDID